MNLPTGDDRRKHSRFETALPIRFNLNPDYHYVPAIRKLGVGGTIRNISWEGIAIHSRMDLLDVCQIFCEEMEGNAGFQLEVSFTDPRKMTHWIKGEVRWYRLSEPDGSIRHFQAGLYLKDAESRAVARSVIESISAKAMK